MWTLLNTFETNTLLPLALRSPASLEKYPWGWIPGQTETGGQHPHFVSPHERSTRRMLSPSIAASSPSLKWVMRYWNHMPSWIPRGSSHPVQSLQSSCWPRTHGCREGGLPASCVGSKYLHSQSSRVARRRGLDVLGYVKSNPPGRIFNRLSLLEHFFSADSLRGKFFILPMQKGTQKALYWKGAGFEIHAVYPRITLSLRHPALKSLDVSSQRWQLGGGEYRSGAKTEHVVRSNCPVA